jgi:flap endonuclease-1
MITSLILKGRLSVAVTFFHLFRVDRYIERLRACRTAKTQKRLDSFFTIKERAVKDSEKFNPFGKNTKAADNKKTKTGLGGIAKKAKK